MELSKTSATRLLVSASAGQTPTVVSVTNAGRDSGISPTANAAIVTGMQTFVIHIREPALAAGMPRKATNVIAVLTVTMEIPDLALTYRADRVLALELLDRTILMQIDARWIHTHKMLFANARKDIPVGVFKLIVTTI